MMNTENIRLRVQGTNGERFRQLQERTGWSANYLAGVLIDAGLSVLLAEAGSTNYFHHCDDLRQMIDATARVAKWKPQGKKVTK